MKTSSYPVVLMILFCTSACTSPRTLSRSGSGQMPDDFFHYESKKETIILTTNYAPFETVHKNVQQETESFFLNKENTELKWTQEYIFNGKLVEDVHFEAQLFAFTNKIVGARMDYFILTEQAVPQNITNAKGFKFYKGLIKDAYEWFECYEHHTMTTNACWELGSVEFFLIKKEEKKLALVRSGRSLPSFQADFESQIKGASIFNRKNY